MPEDNKIHILLIEDNPDEAELVRDLLGTVRRFVFRLTHADCLSRGLAYLADDNGESDRVDIILLDLNLPDSAGFATFDRLFQHAPQMPVILMTGLDDEELALRTVRQGAQDYLVKNELDGNLLARSVMYAIKRKRFEEALRESEERYMLASQGANDGLWDWRMENNRIYFSPRWKSMLGYEEDEIGDQPDEWLDRIHPEDVDRVRVELSAHWQDLREHFKSEHRMQRKDGDYIWVLTRGLAVRDEKGTAYRMAGSQSDITRRKRVEEQLLHDALHDALTGLPNRALFMDRLERSIENVKRHNYYRFAVLVIDLDRFKVINDSLGHAFGDQLLVTVSKLITSCLRAGDSAARLGGDEFVVLLEQVPQVSGAEVISERVLQALQTPIELGGQEVVVSASIGIVKSDIRYEKAGDVLRDGEIAMYHAKMRGKDCHALFHSSMRKRAIARMELENDLRAVLADSERMGREISVVFQPIVSSIDGRIDGFEALLRWTHPERGEIKPGEFIPVAEETGLIHPLGLWVLRQACNQVRIWQSKNSDSPPITVSVNISGKQFARPDLVGQIDKIIRESAIPPSSLSLEITESLLMESDESLLDALEKIRGLGINLQVDDFGSGYSSFSYLQRLPVSSLKIDSLFIRRLGVNGGNSEIVRSIVGLARTLGMSVIAEGVETDFQFQKLKTMDCPFVQGFYISKPVSAEKAGQLVIQNREHLG